MPSIDERIVAMSFENSQFEQRISQTLASLSKLDTAVKNMHGAAGLDDIEKQGNKVTLKGPLAALDKLRQKLGRSGDGAAQGMSDIEKAGNKVTLAGTNKAIDSTQNKLDHLGAGSTFTDIEKASSQVELAGISKAIESVSGRFSMLQQAASVAMGNIASQAAMKGGAFAKSFALGPISQGLDEYKTNLNSIQTILSNTQGQQVSGLGNVNKYLGELNTYSDQTIYNFSEMAKNIGTFTAAGVDLPKATSSIKGIANLAAASGSNSLQASTAMYQLSQAISAGRVGLQDWNSVMNAGMGGALFQKALMRTADNMGTIEKGALKIDKATGKATINGESFRNSIMAKPGQESWLTSDVLTNTLQQFTGDLSDAELSAQGFNAEQIKAIQATAKTAKAAATEVKTLPQVFDVARETIGSGWSKTFQYIFGDFNQSKKTFTEMSNFINAWINRVSDARNKMLGDWSKLGGRNELISGIKQMFVDVTLLLKPIQGAFRDIFPAKTGKDLFNLTKGFHELMVDLRPSPEVIGTIRSAFKILFNVLDFGWNVVKGVAGVIADLLGVVSKGQGGFAAFVGGISQFIDGVHDALIEGGLLQSFFDGLGDILKRPVGLLLSLGHLLANLFTSGGGKAGGAALDGVDQLNQKLPPLKEIIDNVKDAWSKLVGWFGRAKDALEPWLSTFVDRMSSLGDTIKNALSGINFDDVLKGAQTGIMAGFLVMFRDLFGKGGSLMEEVSSTMGAVKTLLGGATESLENMQKKVQAQLIAAIALAVVALAGGIYILSTIDGNKLASAMSAVAIGLGELMGAMKLMSSGLGKFGALSLPVIAAGIIGLAIAVTILAGAMKIFATMSWEDIGKGLAGVAGSLGAIAAGMHFMPSGPTMIAQSGALIALGVALNIIASAIKILGGMKWEDLGKGLFAVVDVLGVLALTMGMMPPNLLVNAAALTVLSFALLTLSGAIKAMGSMDLGTLVKGIGGVLVALAGLGIAMLPWVLVAPSLIPAAAGLFIVANALVVLGKAMEIIGGIGVGGLVKSLVAIGAALIELSIGLTLMIGTLPGALAMMAAAAAFAILAPAIGMLGNMKWSTIFKGLAAIGLSLVVIGTAGLVAAPALAALGIAMIPLGLGFMLVAGAAKIFASALALMSDQGQKGIAVFLTALTGFVALLPTLVISFIKGLVSIVDEIAKIAPRVVEAIGKILTTVINFVTTQAAPLAQAIGFLVDAIILVLVQNAPKLLQSGIQLLMQLLRGISQNIGQVTDKVAEVVSKFLGALQNNLPKLLTAGANFLKAFLNGVSSRFSEIASAVGTLLSKFIEAVGSQAGKIASAAANMMGKFIAAVVNFGPQMLAAGAQAIISFLDGLGNKAPAIVKKGTEAARKLLNGISEGLATMADIGFKAIIKFLNGLEAAIRANSDDLINAGLGVGDAIMDGVVKGFGRGGGAVKKALESVFQLLPGWAKKVLGIKSPSRVFTEIGHFTMAGYSKGLSESKPKVRRDVEDIGRYSMEGLAKGVDDTKDQAVEATMGVGNAMIGSIRRVLAIHSPSEVFREIGMNVNRGFKDGLMGSREDVLSALDSMNSSLIDKIRDLRGQVEDGNGRLEDLQKQHAEKLADIAKMRGEKKPDNDAIADAVKESQDLETQIDEETVAIGKNAKALRAARDIRRLVTQGFKDEKAQLLALKDGYAVITKQLEDAQSALDEATRTRADAQKRLTDQYNVKPDIDQLVSDALAEADMTQQERLDKQTKAEEDAAKRRKINQVELYKQALQEQIVATAKYQATLQKLRELGLDDDTYNKLLEKGLSGQEFADQLLASGKAGIDKINALDAQMLQKSTDLAKQAAANLYNAGVAAAQGLVDGLTTKKADLEKAMTSLADSMVNQIKAKLKIRSPSRVFMEVGRFTTQGLAKGMSDSAGLVAGAADSLANEATNALRGSLSNILDTVGGEVDPTLTITPVLDLTQFRKDAATMGMDNVVPISAATSYGQASATYQEVSASQKAAADAAAESAKPSVTFEQNNFSPESLNDVEIYRKTNNQLGKLKSALGIPS
jgi:tape measure domain-containing protein